MDGSGTADRVDRAEVSPGVSTAGATHTRETDPLTVTQRLQREGRWKDIEPERNEMMRMAKQRFPDKLARQQWVYSELERLYPPETPKSDPPIDVSADQGDTSNFPTLGKLNESGAIQGLGNIPEDWPELPANASLSAEIGWVQANRLRIVRETASGASVVDLAASLTPAPSWAALGWLETSIRSYAKYVDVAAKATASGDGEAEVWRHERMALEEVQALLDEMRQD